MITFRCKRCGQEVSAPDEYSDKQVKCPKCGSVNVAPGTLTKIKFRCKNCGQKISVPQIYAGKRGTCPRCKNTVIIPKAESPQPRASQSNSSDLETISKGSDLDPSVFDIPQESKAATQPISQYDVSDRAFENVQKLEERPEADEAEAAGRRKLPWIIDICLYPISVSGLANLAIFLGVPELIDFLQKIILVQLACLFWLVGVVIKVIVALFMYWYFAECIRDSAEGGLRAPNVIRDVPRVVDMFWQMVNIVGCLVVFFAPFVLYLLIARRVDVIFWLLLFYAIFFFPMALLAVVVFDSVSGLNPRLLYNSISNTLRQYCGLVLLFVAAVLLIGVLGQKVAESEHLAFLLRCVSIYLAFVGAHLLGRFYWRYQEKLNWEV